MGNSHGNNVREWERHEIESQLKNSHPGGAWSLVLFEELRRRDELDLATKIANDKLEQDAANHRKIIIEIKEANITAKWAIVATVIAALLGAVVGVVLEYALKREYETPAPIAAIEIKKQEPPPNLATSMQSTDFQNSNPSVALSTLQATNPPPPTSLPPSKTNVTPAQIQVATNQTSATATASNTPPQEPTNK